MSFFVPQAREDVRWSDWCASFVGYNPTITNLPLPRPEKDWKDWAQRLQELPQLAQYTIPFPDSFEDWRLWAIQLLGALDGYN